LFRHLAGTSVFQQQPQVQQQCALLRSFRLSFSSMALAALNRASSCAAVPGGEDGQ
jgi:hypothetical protein